MEPNNEHDERLEKLYDLYGWIDKHTISRPKNNVSRDFADAIPVAEILYHHYPEIVELHNYAPVNSYAKKVENWEILNRKVLKKINITLTKEQINNIVNRVTGAIEDVLLRIKEAVDNKDNPDYCGDSGKRKAKMVPRRLLDEGAKELDKVNQKIKGRNEKISELQDLIDQKNAYITELQNKVAEYEAKANAGIFNKFF